jgi:hypothetical protein
MSHLRNLIHDLVERRLWPVALLLAVALAAVPVVLGRGGDDATPTAALPTPATGADDATAQNAEVTVDTSVPVVRERPGTKRNPFVAPASARTTTTTETNTQTDEPNVTPNASPDTGAAPTSDSGSASSGSGSSSSGSDSSGSTGSGSTGGSSGSTTTTKPATKPKTPAPKAEDVSDTYHVSLRVTVDGGKATTVRDIARLSPLPSVTDPFFVYLGILRTTGKNPEKRAVFVVSSDATPNGEGACHPSKQDCETIELTVGQTAFFDYTAPDGKLTQYQLELAGIHKTVVHAQAKAAAAFARHSVAGADLLRDAATHAVRAAGGARAYRYLPAAGLLVRAKHAKVTAKAAAAGAKIPAITLLARKNQPGIPVWHSPKK